MEVHCLKVWQRGVALVFSAFIYSIEMKKPDPTMCTFCVYFDLNNNTERPRCQAFPNGIPEEIVFGRFDHRLPYPNKANPQDNGLKWRPVEEFAESAEIIVLGLYGRLRPSR